jgi:hypothetical protein
MFIRPRLMRAVFLDEFHGEIEFSGLDISDLA